MTHPLARSGLLAAAICFTAYPTLRPYGPEAGTAGAADFAQPRWLLAHALGMAGFVLLALVLRLAAADGPGADQPSRRRTETLGWLAASLLLPYYGAEAYGLHELGRYAVAHRDPGVLAVADAFRFAPFEITTFGLGLVLWLVVGVRVARASWAGETATRIGGMLVGVGLVTYLPQFLAGPEVRIGHGVLLGLGLVALALGGSAPQAVQLRSQTVWGDASSLASASGETASAASVTT